MPRIEFETPTPKSAYHPRSHIQRSQKITHGCPYCCEEVDAAARAETQTSRGICACPKTAPWPLRNHEIGSSCSRRVVGLQPLGARPRQNSTVLCLASTQICRRQDLAAAKGSAFSSLANVGLLPTFRRTSVRHQENAGSSKLDDVCHATPRRKQLVRRGLLWT